MPARVVVTTENGTMVEGEIEVDDWLAGGGRRTATVSLPASGRVIRVEIDPRHLFPDADRSNNLWTPGGTAAPR